MKPIANALSSVVIITLLAHSSTAAAQARTPQNGSHATQLLYSMIALMADQNPERARSFIQTNFDTSADQADQLIEISRGLRSESARANEAFKIDVCENPEYYAEDKNRIISEARRREIESLGLVEESAARMEQTLGSETSERIETWVQKELQPQVVNTNTESALRGIAQSRSISGQSLVATICR